MGAWDSSQYLKFERDRTLPCRDLVARLELDSPDRIADLGCGTGTSTAVLRARWPDARLIGVDSSPEMLGVARKAAPHGEWILADISSWKAPEPLGLVFSNAALQ